MNALAVDRTARRSRQRQVEALLSELDERRSELYRLQANGVRRAGMRDLKRELLEVQRRLRRIAITAEPKRVDQTRELAGLEPATSWVRQ